MNIAMLLPLAASGGGRGREELDLAGRWNTLWGDISDSLGNIDDVMGVIGLVIMFFAFVKWGWDRRRGGGGMGNSGGIVGAALVGALLAAPNAIIPVLLGIVDVLVNALVGIWDKTSA